MSGATRDRGDDFVAQLLDLIASVSGGFGDPKKLSQLGDAIRDAYGGQQVYVQRSGWFDRAERDQRIHADRAAGRSIGWIANRYCLSRSGVVHILQAAPGGDPRDPAAFC